MREPDNLAVDYLSSLHHQETDSLPPPPPCKKTDLSVLTLFFFFFLRETLTPFPFPSTYKSRVKKLNSGQWDLSWLSVAKNERKEKSDRLQGEVGLVKTALHTSSPSPIYLQIMLAKSLRGATKNRPCPLQIWSLPLNRFVLLGQWFLFFLYFISRPVSLLSPVLRWGFFFFPYKS